MSDQTKRLLFMVLTLPGVAFPFMDFTDGTSPFELLLGRVPFTTPSDALCVWVVFAPIALLLLDSWRLLRPAPRPVVVLVLIYGLVTGALFLWELITGITGGFRQLRGLDIATLGIGLGSIATTAALVAYGWRHKIAVDRLAEVGLMGASISIVATYVVGYGGDYGLDAGAYIGLYICLVFLVRIIDTLRHPVLAQSG